MRSPIVNVRNVKPGYPYYARINPANFWKMVVAKTTPQLTGTDSELKDGLVRLALGPQLTTDEIVGNDIATNMDGSPLDENFSPADFAEFVVHGMLTDPEVGSIAKEYFFSRAVLEEAGIIPKAA